MTLAMSVIEVYVVYGTVSGWMTLDTYTCDTYIILVDFHCSLVAVKLFVKEHIRGSIAAIVISAAKQ